MKQKYTGAETIMENLKKHNISTIFGYIGGAIMPLYNAFSKYQNSIKHIMNRHEQGAIHAAQGYARSTGKTGVCFATSGPGATNLITGLADAYSDSTPLVCITGQVGSNLLGTDAFQEVDIISLSIPVTKWNYQITKANEIDEVISKAFHLANSGRKGPVLIDITKDCFFELTNHNFNKKVNIRSYDLHYDIDQNKLIKAKELIDNAQKPLILIGQGVSLAKAFEELKIFAEKTNIPVASTLLGLSAFPSNHKQFIGMLGMHGNYAPNIATTKADLIIAIGMRFDDRVTGDAKYFAPLAKIIHLDIDYAEIDKIITTDVGLVGDCKFIIPKLTELCLENNFSNWLEEIQYDNQKEIDYIHNYQLDYTSSTCRMGGVINMISELTNGQSLIITDVGQQQMMTARYYNFSRPNSFISSGGIGTMGFGLPAAIGAKLGNPNRQVLLFVGDGGFQMTLQELATIVEFDIKIKIIVLNNNFLGMVRQWQDLFFDKNYFATEMTNPNLESIVKAYGIETRKAENYNQLKKAAKDLINNDNVKFLEVMVETEDNVFPMVPAGKALSEIRLQ